MSEENTTSPEGGSTEGTAAPAAKKGMNPIIVAVVGAVAGIGIILALLLFTPLKKLIGGGGEHKASEEINDPGRKKDVDINKITFLPLPETLVNLKNTGKGRGNILKAIFVLELASEADRNHINQFIPLIVDQFQTYLREMEMTDLQGAAGIEKTRQELEARVNQVVAPIKVRQVLVKDFLVQ